MWAVCPQGKAIIRQYENGHPEGHYTIEVKHDDLSYSTHQVVTNPDYSETTVVRAGRYNLSKVPVHTAEIPLPNAQAAINKQKSLINEELGRYDTIDNSCLSHVCDIIEEGGGPAATRTQKGYMKYMRANGFKLIR